MKGKIFVTPRFLTGLSGMALLGLAACADVTGGVPRSALHPDPASGLMLSPMSLTADLVIPPFGVRPGNNRTVLQSLAEAEPAQIAPLFARYRAGRAAGTLPADHQLTLPLPERDDIATAQAAAAKICASAGAAVAELTEKPPADGGMRHIGIRCT